MLKNEANEFGIADEIIKNIDQCNDVVKIFLEFYKSNAKEAIETDVLNVLSRVKKMLGARGECLNLSSENIILIKKI